MTWYHLQTQSKMKGCLIRGSEISDKTELKQTSVCGKEVVSWHVLEVVAVISTTNQLHPWCMNMDTTTRQYNLGNTVLGFSTLFFILQKKLCKVQDIAMTKYTLYKLSTSFAGLFRAGRQILAVK